MGLGRRGAHSGTVCEFLLLSSLSRFVVLGTQTQPAEPAGSQKWSSAREQLARPAIKQLEKNQISSLFLSAQTITTNKRERLYK
jgi:hypothetical protein